MKWTCSTLADARKLQERLGKCGMGLSGLIQTISGTWKDIEEDVDLKYESPVRILKSKAKSRSIVHVMREEAELGSHHVRETADSLIHVACDIDPQSDIFIPRSAVKVKKEKAKVKESGPAPDGKAPLPSTKPGEATAQNTKSGAKAPKE